MEDFLDRHALQIWEGEGGAIATATESASASSSRVRRWFRSGDDEAAPIARHSTLNIPGLGNVKGFRVIHPLLNKPDGRTHRSHGEILLEVLSSH